MQPYQEAAEETRRSGETPLNLLKYAAGGGLAKAGSLIAGKAIARLAPMLSPLIPEALAKKGLSKIDPRFGKFISASEEQGADWGETRDFLSEKVSSAQQEPAKENRNIIEQESPELFSFLDQAIKGGRNPIEAAAIAQNDKRFAPIIKKLMKAHKTPWSSIIESIFGKGDQGKAAALQQFNARKNPGMMEGLQEQFQGQYGQQPQQGQGEQAIMQALQMAAESRKRRQQ